MPCTTHLFPHSMSGSHSEVKDQVFSSQLLKTTVASVIKLHAKGNSNEMVCFYEKLGSFAQDQGHNQRSEVK